MHTEKSCGWKLIESDKKDCCFSTMGSATFTLYTGTTETFGSDTRETFLKICYKKYYCICKIMLLTLRSLVL